MQLGLCNPPEPIYLYVKADESGSCLWYKFNVETQATTPVKERGLCGNLVELKIVTKEYKGKENLKLDIVVQADELYIIRSGMETNFTKTFLLAIAQAQDLAKPLIFAVSAGEENVVFCRLYDAVSKQRLKAEWDKNANWSTIVMDTQIRLSGKTSLPQINIPPSNLDRDLLIEEINSQMKRKQITIEMAKSFLAAEYRVKSRLQLSDSQLQDVRDLFASVEKNDLLDGRIHWTSKGRGLWNTKKA